MPDELITSIREAAKFLGCGEVTIYRRIKRGEFPKPVQEFGMNTKATKNYKGMEKIRFRRYKAQDERKRKS